MSTLRLCLLAVVLVCFNTAHAEVDELNNLGLSKMMADGVTIIDVRREDEWQATGMLEGSHGITFFDQQGHYDVNTWLNKVSELVAPDQSVVLICASGVRSSRIAELLDARLGFSAVHNVTGGMVAWIRGGNPVVSQPKAVPAPASLK